VYFEAFGFVLSVKPDDVIEYFYPSAVLIGFPLPSVNGDNFRTSVAM